MMEAAEQGSGSGVNTPHPDDEKPEDFFGDPKGDPAASLVGDDDEPTGEPAEPVVPAEEPSAPAADPPPPPPPPPAAAEETASPATGEGRKYKTEPRDYEVLQELRLTETVLQALLKEAKESNEANARRVLLPLGKVKARGGPQAYKLAFRTFRSTLGDSARLAIVASGVKVEPVGVVPREAESIKVG